jgi:hypothetical protein
VHLYQTTAVDGSMVLKRIHVRRCIKLGAIVHFAAAGDHIFDTVCIDMFMITASAKGIEYNTNIRQHGKNSPEGNKKRVIHDICTLQKGHVFLKITNQQISSLPSTGE